MADTASLVVRVSSQGVSQTSRELDRLSDSAGGAEASAASMTKVMRGLIGVGAAVGTAAVTAAAGLGAIAVASAKSDKELANLATTAKTTREDFAALSFAFKQYNVDAKGTADAMNDVSERLGEFAAAGTGPFQDFADVMGLTKQQAVDMANELQRLKPEDAIQRMVNQMEAAGVEGAKMSFVMKSMSNDLEYASVAFADGGKKLADLKKRFEDVNGAMAITASQSADLAELSTTTDLLTSSLGNAATSISATVAPIVTDFFNNVIDIVPKAEQAIVDFLNRFIEVESMNSIEAVNKEFERQTQIMEANQWAQDALANKTLLVGKAQDQQIAALERYNEAQARSEELIFQRLQLEDELKAKMLEDARTPAGTGVGKEAAKVAAKDTTDSEAQAKQAAAFLEQLRQANLNEMQLIDVQQQEKTAKLDEYKALGLLKEQEYQDALTNIQTTAVLARAELETQMLDEQSKLKDEMRRADLARAAEEERRRQKTLDDGIDAQRNMTANLKSSLGEQSAIYKASAIATATIDTYKAATGAYSAMASIPYVGPILGAAAAGAAIVAGLANVAAIRGAREQGGSMIGGSAYQMAERGKAEVIVPAGASRARTAAQMRDIMGQNGSQQAPNFTIVNQTQGRIDNVSTERQSDGSWLLRIEEFMSEQALDPDSMFSKALRV